MSILSEFDIVWELGNSIFIYPFDGIHKSFNGGCLRLKASDHAYIINKEKYYQDPSRKVKLTKELIPLEVKSKESGDKYIMIPPKKTAIVWTRESIVLKNGWFCGSVHSKVPLAASSIGHIGTRVNPYWSGVLSIALHNTSEEEVEIILEKDTIAYVRFYKFKSRSLDRSSFSNASEKLANALPKNCSVHPKLKEWVSENSWRDGDVKAIKSQLEADRKARGAELTTYQVAKRDYWIEKFNIPFLSRDQKIPILSIIKFLITPFIGWIIGLNWDWILDFLHKLLQI